MNECKVVSLVVPYFSIEFEEDIASTSAIFFSLIEKENDNGDITDKQ